MVLPSTRERVFLLCLGRMDWGLSTAVQSGIAQGSCWIIVLVRLSLPLFTLFVVYGPTGIFVS